MMWRSHSANPMGALLRNMSGVLSNSNLNLKPLGRGSAPLPPLQPKSHWEQHLKPIKTKPEKA